MNNSPLSPDDPRLLALTLGEITDPAERAVIEAAVAADPALRAACDAHRELSAGLRASLSREPLPFVVPDAVVAGAMSGSVSPARRRRASGLGGSLHGVRHAQPGASRMLTFAGFGAAAAACVALFLLTRPPEAAPAANRLALNPPSVPIGMHVAPALSGDLASLAGAMPGLPGAGVAFRPAGRAAIALSAPNARAYAAAFSRELAAGRRPVAPSVRLDGLVNAFVGARPVAPGASPVLVETALTATPWNPTHRLLRVTVRAQGPAGELVARNAVASAEFAAAGVKSWRILGHAGTTVAPEAVALHAGDTVTTLYEIDPVSPESPGAALATVNVRYANVGRPGRGLLSVPLAAGDCKSFQDTDADTRFAAGLAAYAMGLGDNPAGTLAACAGDDADRLAFAALAR